MNSIAQQEWAAMQRDALPTIVTLRQRVAKSSGRRRCTAGHHVIERGGQFEEWVGVIDGDFQHQTTCFGCMDDSAGVYDPDFSRCANPGPHGCAQCDACITWGDEAYHRLKEEGMI